MRISRLVRLLTGCAILALATPASAQDAPVVMDPPLRPPGPQSPVVIPVPEVTEPDRPYPPLVVPARDPTVGFPPPAVPAIPADWSPVPFDEAGRSAYGLFLTGRVAAQRGDRARAADMLVQSQALTPEQPTLLSAAYEAALFSGDIEAVVRLAPMVVDTPLYADAGRLFTIVDLLARNQPRDARSLVAQGAASAPFGPVLRYLGPSVAAAAGDWDAALAPVEAAPTDPASLVLRNQRAQLLERRGRFAEAEAEYAALLTTPDAWRGFGVHQGAFLERRGRRDEAVVAYGLALSGSNPDPRAFAGLNGIRAGRPAPPVPSVARIAADVLVSAAGEARTANDGALEIIYLRLAMALDAADPTALRLGNGLARGGEAALALEAYDRVSQANGILYASAQVGRADILGETDRGDEALTALLAADRAAPDQVEVGRLLAGQLLAQDQPEAALEVLNRPHINTADPSLNVRYLRAQVLERLGRIEEAEAELWAVLQVVPDSPQLLNHLGYLWVDSGRRVDQGAEMIARAHAADPENGNIQDSLGWAQYRQGQYELAVETLEQAVAKEPANAEINDHLGDAYWQVGRAREASWQWTRVLTLTPDAKRRASVEAKLTSGLPDAPSQVLGAGGN